MGNALRNVMEKMNLRAPEEATTAEDLYEDSYDYTYDENSQWDGEAELEADIVSLPQGRSGADLSRIVTVRPRRYGDEETLTIANSLRDGIPVIVHMGGLDESGQQSLFHFMSGVVYVLRGHMQHVTSLVYLLSPQQVKIVNGEGEDLSTKNR